MFIKIAITQLIMGLFYMTPRKVYYFIPLKRPGSNGLTLSKTCKNVISSLDHISQVA